MLEAQPKVNENLSQYAPLITNIIIPEDKMGWVIGKRGSNIQKLRNDNPNVKVYLDNKTREMKLESHKFMHFMKFNPYPNFF